MATLKTRKTQSNKILDEIEKLGDEVDKASVRLYNQAIDNSLKYNETKTPFIASSLTLKTIDNNLARIITRTEDSFEDIIKNIQKSLAQGYDIDLTKANIEAIRRSKSLIIDKLINNTNILKEDVSTLLVSNLGKGVQKRQLVRELSELYPAYSRNANTIINTGVSHLYQDINASKFEEVGFDWYLWAGPDDSVTRDIPCKHWVNHKFPASQLPILRSTRQNLWNCRHSIIPITKEDAKDFPTGDISFANS